MSYKSWQLNLSIIEFYSYLIQQMQQQQQTIHLQILPLFNQTEHLQIAVLKIHQLAQAQIM